MPATDRSCRAPLLALALSRSAPLAAPTPFWSAPLSALTLALGALLAGCCGTPRSHTGPEPIGTARLLREMTDLHDLARFPDPPYSCKQFSSYDRASTTPANHEKWFANNDAGQFLRVEEHAGRKEFVLADMDGPGAIVRIWSANPVGTLRIYLDHAPTPAIETPLAEFLGGGFRGAPKPIAGEYSKGWNSYFPIPYARHCKVTSDQGGFYYHLNYRTYAADVAVETFSAAHLRTASHAIYDVARELAWPSRGDGCLMIDHAALIEPRSVLLRPGESTAFSAAGEREVSRLMVALPDARTDAAALREVVLSARFDGAQTVETPVGDFFSCVPELTRNESLPMHVDESGLMISLWRMPFRERASISLQNRGQTDRRVFLHVETMHARWTERSMHFHAKWRQSVDLRTRPMIDWNYLSAAGQGVFVGAALAIANPVRTWWGEGDEKIYVDGESFPSHFGTGTEDYFGYAWCWPAPFAHAYHNQPRCDGPGNYGHTSVNRWHVLDRIPFTRDFRFDMELWHWDEKTSVAMSIVAFWYARPGATDGFAALRSDDLRVVRVPRYEPKRVAGAIEGESLRILAKTARLDPQGIEACSNEAHLWWREGVKIGDTLALGFDAPTAGRYRVLARCMTAGDYGTHRLSVNGQPGGEPRDFYNNGIKAGDEFVLGEFELGAGENRLEVECTGSSPASKGLLFGLDYLRIERLP